jgi:hypothetical protein
MTRSLWSLVALVGCTLALSGCAMCEHCLDYDYPAFGGCCGWHADDHCRAGSAFCGMHAHGGFDVPHDALPYAPPSPQSPENVTTPPVEERPPADLSPPSGRRMRPAGNEPLPRTDLPDTQIPDTEIPESDLPEGELPESELPDTEFPALPEVELPPLDDAPPLDPLDR